VRRNMDRTMSRSVGFPSKVISFRYSIAMIEFTGHLHVAEVLCRKMAVGTRMDVHVGFVWHRVDH